MTFAPVCIPTLNRISHLSKCVESLKACEYANKTELVIGVDYPTKDEQIKGWLEVKKYVKTIDGFERVTVFFRKANVGIHENYRLLREYAFANYDRMIFSEDDNVFSPCFLDYMNNSLEKFKSDPEIWGICSFFQSEYIDLSSYTSNIIKIKGYYCDYGSGIWKDKFEKRKNSIHVPYQKYVCSQGKKLRVFKSYLSLFFLFVRIKDVYPDLQGPCDISYAVSSILNDKYYIVPTIPIVKNIGYDGTGTYCGEVEEDLYSSREITQEKRYEFVINEDFETEKEIISERHSEARGWRADSRGEFLSLHHRNKVPLLIDCYEKFGYGLSEFMRKQIVGRRLFKFFMRHVPRPMIDFVKNKLI